MQPRKDYDDYTTFINDTFNEKKVAMLKTFSEKTVNRKESRTQSSNPYASNTNEHWLKRMNQMRNSSTMSGSKNMHLRNLSHRITTPQGEKSDLTGDWEVKPRILESKVSDSDKFMRLSDGFKRCFS